jgi:hypothetical protein
MQVFFEKLETAKQHFFRAITYQNAPALWYHFAGQVGYVLVKVLYLINMRWVPSPAASAHFETMLADGYYWAMSDTGQHFCELQISYAVGVSFSFILWVNSVEVVVHIKAKAWKV